MSQKTTINPDLEVIIPNEFKGVPWYHFSVDDVFDSLIEVSTQNISLFSHPFFSLLKEMNDQYDTQVDLELFWSREIDGKLFTLKDVRDLRQELKESGSWLRFGPHAESYMVPPYDQSPEEQRNVFEQTYQEIDRFAGRETYAQFVRLHCYSESYELFDYFKDKGVVALFTTDREIGSHRMGKKTAESLLNNGFASYEGMNFIRTQFRVEVLTNHRINYDETLQIFKEVLLKYGYIIFYSHEYEFARSEVRSVLRMMFRALKELDCVSIKHNNNIRL